MRVQQGRKFPSQFASTLVSTRRGKKMTEVQQQAQGIKLRQTAARIVPFFYEFRALRRRRKKTLQERRRVVVEAQISRGELLFENRHSREQRQRTALHAVRGPQAYLALTLEERARDPPANVFRKRQRAVVQIEMKIGPVNGGVPNVVHALRIESDRTDARVEGARGLGTLEARCQRPSRSCQKPQNQRDHQSQPYRSWLHKQFSGKVPLLRGCGKSRFRCPAPKRASCFEELTVSLKRYPDTRPEFFRKLFSDAKVLPPVETALAPSAETRQAASLREIRFHLRD